MRPELLHLPAPSLLQSLLLLAVLAALIGGWLFWLRRRGDLSRDHLTTAGVILAVGAVIVLVMQRMAIIRGGLSIPAYGAMLALGFLAGTVLAIHLGRRRGVEPERVMDLGLVIVIGAIVGARLGYVLNTPMQEPLFDFRPMLLQGVGGLSFHGGFIGGLLTASVYILVNKLSYWRVADTMAPAIALGYAITRIGCFLNGCCYGKPAEHLAWAMNFPLSPDGPVYHVHPTQLYASLIGFAMFGILLWLSRGNSLVRAGRLFMLFLMLEGVERFVMEIFRQPDPRFTGGLTQAQWVSIALLIIGALAYRFLPQRPAIVEPVDAAPAKKKAAVGR